MKNWYPGRNPFPHQATVSFQGKREDSEAQGPSGRQPTLLLPPIKKAHEQVARYLTNFPEDGQGQIILFRGEHGSGKTHAINYVMGRTAAGDPILKENVRKARSLYVKADGPDFLSLYRNLMSYLSFTELREVAYRFLSVMTAQQLGKELSGAQAGSGIANGQLVDAAALTSDSEALSKAFSTYLVEEGAVQDRQAREIERIAGARQDFQRVLSSLLGVALAEAAYDWLLGRDVSLDVQKKLGVAGTINSVDSSTLALRLLATLYTRGSQSLLIYVDQYEKLVLTDDREVITQNLEAIRKLVEGIPGENALLLMAGNGEAWRALPQDVRMRFGTHVVDFPLLTLDEAKDLIHLYLTPSGQDTRPSREKQNGVDETELMPFTEPAVREIVSYTQGNVRRVLQLCSECFDIASEGPLLITPELVGQAQKERQAAFDKQSVTREIERLAVERSLKSQTGFVLSGARADLALVDDRGGLRLLVQVSEAVFYDDEAERALESLDIVAEIQKMERPVPLVLVVLGYVSREVTDKLARAVYELVVYRPETFSTEFGALLKRVTTTAPAMSYRPAAQDSIERQLAEVRSAVEELARGRKSEAVTLDDRVTSLVQQQAIDRAKDRREQVRQVWLAERTSIEDRIQSVRQERRNRDLEELERLRGKAVSYQQRRALLLAAFALTLALTWGVVSLTNMNSGLASYQSRADSLRSQLEKQASQPSPSVRAIPSPRPYRSGYSYVDGEMRFLYRASDDLKLVRSEDMMFLYGAGMGIAFYLLFALNVLGAAWKRELSARMGSAEELDRLARKLMPRPTTPRRLLAWVRVLMPKPPSARKLLRHPNPQVRYTGAAAADPDRDFEPLREALISELSSLVRRALARKVAKSKLLTPSAVTELAPTVPEVAYLVEGLASRSNRGDLKEVPLSPSLKLLAVMSGAPVKETGRDIALELAWIERQRGDWQQQFPFDHSAGMNPDVFAGLAVTELGRPIGPEALILATSYERGSDEPGLSAIGESDLREAIRELSPFEAPGLGTFDELRDLSKVDQFYLFFHQILFLMQRDALMPASNTGSQG